MDARFSIAQLTNHNWVWKLVNYCHVYHRSREYKTRKSCLNALKNFMLAFDAAYDESIYECKELQKPC